MVELHYPAWRAILVHAFENGRCINCGMSIRHPNRFATCTGPVGVR